MGCANQMVSDKVPAVLMNLSGQQAPIIKGLIAGKIPLFESVAADPVTLASHDAFVLQNIIATSAEPAQLLKDAGGKRAAYVIPDIPNAVTLAKTILPIFYKNAGGTVDFVTVPPGTADMTPQLQSALTKKPDLFSIAGLPDFCVAALKGLKTLGYTGPIVMVSQCLTDDFAQSVGSSVAGVKVTASTSFDTTKTEVKMYQEVMAKYAPGVAPFAGVAPGGYAVALGFARAMSGLTSGDITSASVKSTISSAAAQPMPLAPGIKFQCNGKATPFSAAICSTGGLITTLDAKGKPTTFQPFDTSAIAKLG